MPHPIDSVVYGANAIIRPGAAAQNRAQLMLMFSETLTRWSFAEAAVGDALAVILREDAVQVVRRFIQQPNSKRQRETLMEYAEQQLPADDLETLRILLKLCEDDFKQRNKLAHWLTGYSPQIPDGILLMNPSEQWSHAADFWVWLEDALSKTEYDPLGQRPEPPRDKIYVYKADDFRKMSASINELISAFDAFNEMYSVVAGDGRGARARGYAQLCSLPRFLQERARREGRRTAQDLRRSQSDVGPPRRFLSHLTRFLARFFGAAD